jgi:DoxX-like family
MMKTQIWVERILTGLLAALMALSAAPDVLRSPGALSVFEHLGYPPYLLGFLGTAKLLGVAVLLAPGAPRIKEWAFAGLTFDLAGALYSHISVGDPPTVWMPALIGLVLAGSAYVARQFRIASTTPLGSVRRRLEHLGSTARSDATSRDMPSSLTDRAI